MDFLVDFLIWLSPLRLPWVYWLLLWIHLHTLFWWSFFLPFGRFGEYVLESLRFLSRICRLSLIHLFFCDAVSSFYSCSKVWVEFLIILRLFPSTPFLRRAYMIASSHILSYAFWTSRKLMYTACFSPLFLGLSVWGLLGGLLWHILVCLRLGILLILLSVSLLFHLWFFHRLCLHYLQAWFPFHLNIYPSGLFLCTVG